MGRQAPGRRARLGAGLRGAGLEPERLAPGVEPPAHGAMRQKSKRLDGNYSGRFLGARHAILGPRLFFPFFCRPFFSLGWLAGWFSFMPGCLASGGHSLLIIPEV